MRVMRSILCAGLAMIAVSLCAAMPASAAVPIDASHIIQPLSAKDYPAPAITVTSPELAILPSAAPNISPVLDRRSSTGNTSPSFASTKTVSAAYLHIDPGRMRC